ncbi:hypothetical protein C0992_010739 [Termitomyces sp. T32_za158]|nr:hypothetical protein C0992_010739 [Termitomyces sp. T32_za158]
MSQTSFDGNTPSRPVNPPRSQDDGPGPKTSFTPILNHRAVSGELNAITEKLESRLAGLHAEISGRVVGPVDVEVFNEFLPPAQGIGTKPDGRAAYQVLAPVLKDATNEQGMYKALVEYLKELCPSGNVNFCDKHDNVLRVFNGIDIKPDIVVYLNNDDAAIEAMFEVKYNDSDDPFDDQIYGFQRESNDSKRTLGQITSYATYHQAREFRTHAFSALIFRSYVRLFRWDRSGVVATRKILLDNPSLFDFFDRFTSATIAERGRDCTVTANNLPLSEMTGIRRLLECNEEAPLLAIPVGDKNYIILKDQPLGSASPIGRSTRSFKAYCLQDKMVVFLKDSWRVVSPTLKPEHEIYAKLHEHNVANIPRVYHGADIGNVDSNHLTQTKLWLGKIAKPFELALQTHRHYRIVLEYLPFTLDESEIPRETINIIREASIAYGDAATKARVLHRDISNGNIMFRRKQDGTIQGYLVNWDLSLDLDLAGEKSTEVQPERMGAWQFLAIRLLEPDQGKPLVQNRIDDDESFYHLTLWMALRYTVHALPSGTLTRLLRDNFDARPETVQPFLASARRPNMKSGDLIEQARFANAGVEIVLQGLRYVLRERYTNPAREFGDLKVTAQERNEAEVRKAVKTSMLEKDPYWLPNTLADYLRDGEIDWSANAGRFKHSLTKPFKFV